VTILKPWLLALLSVLVLGPALGEDWIEYRPAGMGYRIELPKAWTLDSKDVPTDVGLIKMQMATVDGGSTVYMSIYSDFPQSHIDRTPADLLLDNARNGAVKNVKGTLLSEQKFKLGGHPGRHIVVDTPSARVSQSLVLHKTTLIQAIYVGAAGDETRPDVVRFFKSLAIAKP